MRMKINLKTLKEGGEIIFNFVVKNSPTILTTIGVIAMAAGTVKAIVEAPKAKEELEDIESDPDLTHKDYIKAKSKVLLYHYWSTAALTVGGAGVIFWGHKISLARTAAALAAYQMSKDDLKKLEDKIIETDGEKKLNKYKDAIMKDEINAAPLNLLTVENTGHGNMLFYEPIGKRYFISDIEFIRQMCVQANDELKEQRFNGRKRVISLNRWFEYIDLSPLDGTQPDDKKVAPDIGKDLGWRNREIRLKFTSFVMPNNEHCTVLGYLRGGEPTWDTDIDDEYYDLEDSSDYSSRGKVE